MEAEIERATDIYFDTVSQVRMNRWTKGRVALVGDVATAFARYEQRLMSFLRKKQQSAEKFSSAFAPKTSFGIALRDVITQLMRIPGVAELVIGRDLRDEIVLPVYSASRVRDREH